METSTNHRGDAGFWETSVQRRRGRAKCCILFFHRYSCLCLWGGNTVSICPVIRLHLHVERGGEEPLIFLTAPGRNKLMAGRVAAGYLNSAEKDTPVWRTISPKTRGPSPERRESSAWGEWREKNGSAHWLWTTECAAWLLYEVNLSISDWRQTLNGLIALWLDLTRETQEAKCDTGRWENSKSDTVKRKERLVIDCWHTGITQTRRLNPS